eukprot:gene14340-20333_t
MEDGDDSPPALLSESDSDQSNEGRSAPNSALPRSPFPAAFAAAAIAASAAACSSKASSFTFTGNPPASKSTATSKAPAAGKAAAKPSVLGGKKKAPQPSKGDSSDGSGPPDLISDSDIESDDDPPPKKPTGSPFNLSYPLPKGMKGTEKGSSSSGKKATGQRTPGGSAEAENPKPKPKPFGFKYPKVGSPASASAADPSTPPASAAAPSASPASAAAPSASAASRDDKGKAGATKGSSVSVEEQQYAEAQRAANAQKQAAAKAASDKKRQEAKLRRATSQYSERYVAGEVVNAPEFQQSVLNEREELRRKAGFLPDTGNEPEDEIHGRCSLRPGASLGSGKCEFISSNCFVKESQRYMSVRCTEGCNCLYHQSCWRKFKDDYKEAYPDRQELLKGTKHMFPCITEGCQGYLLSATLIGNEQRNETYVMPKQLEEQFRKEQARVKAEKAAAYLAMKEALKPKKRKKESADADSYSDDVVAPRTHYNSKCGVAADSSRASDQDGVTEATSDAVRTNDTGRGWNETPAAAANDASPDEDEEDTVALIDERMLVPLRRLSSGGEDGLVVKPKSNPVAVAAPAARSAQDAAGPSVDEVKSKKKKKGMRVNLVDFLEAEAAAAAEASQVEETPPAAAPVRATSSGAGKPAKASGSKKSNTNLAHPSDKDFPNLDGSATKKTIIKNLAQPSAVDFPALDGSIIPASIEALALADIEDVPPAKQALEALKMEAVALSFVEVYSAYTARMFSHHRLVYKKKIKISLLERFPSDVNMCRASTGYPARQPAFPPPAYPAPGFMPLGSMGLPIFPPPGGVGGMMPGMHQAAPGGGVPVMTTRVTHPPTSQPLPPPRPPPLPAEGEYTVTGRP